MKKLFIAISLIVVGFVSQAQYSIQGYLYERVGRLPVEAATVSAEQNGVIVANAVSDNSGYYQIKGLKKMTTYRLIIEHVSMKKADVIVHVQQQSVTQNITLDNFAYFLEPLEIKSLRASDKAPFAKTNLTKQDIARVNFGQDLPFILNQTPSVVVNSDAGNGIGYTGIRIRGSDASRINVTMNGIPYNDAESQGSFFVDLPDIASSAASIQIQRGVGSSSNGVGSFGASLNISTHDFNALPYTELNNTFGSFNTWKNTVKVGTGLLNQHFTIDARVSSINSDGYIDRASTDLKSLYLSSAYVSSKSTIRFNFIAGKEKTYQAWYGVPESLLQSNRTYNSAGTEKPGTPYDNETDNYWQDHYQLFLNHSFNNKFSINTGFFLSKGRGYYEQYKADVGFADYNLPNFMSGNDTITNTDLVRQLWLQNSYYGQIFSLSYKSSEDQITLGGGWTRYIGNHFGRIPWAKLGVDKEFEYYRLNASKTDYSMYGKWQRSVMTNLILYADIQYRHVNYDINGFRNNPTVNVSRQFNFLNPKAGLTYTHKDYQMYLSYALGQKEPNRDDFEAGILQQPKHETLNDLELGIERKNKQFDWSANVFYMRYKNQLILSGKINDVGAYTRVNVPNSYRLGVELQAKKVFTSWLHATATLSLSRNKINATSEYLDDYDNGGQVKINYTHTDISFSPSAVGSATVAIIPVKNFEINVLSKFVSRQYLDNSQQRNRSLQPFSLQDLIASYTVKNKWLNQLTINFAAYNVFDKKYAPNGYTYSYINGGQTTTENFYFPMAGRNFMVGLQIKMGG